MRYAPRPAAQRKRTRKRKRRNVSDSDSSDSDSSDATSAVDDQPSKAVSTVPAAPEPEGSSDSSSADSSDSDSDLESRGASEVNSRTKQDLSSTRNPAAREPSASFTPPVPAPSIFATNAKGSGNNDEEQRLLKERFRGFWMTSMVDAFRDDLDEIRKESNMTTSRLELLIESLAAGADIYSSSAEPAANDVNEMEVILDGR